MKSDGWFFALLALWIGATIGGWLPGRTPLVLGGETGDAAVEIWVEDSKQPDQRALDATLQQEESNQAVSNVTPGESAAVRRASFLLQPQPPLLPPSELQPETSLPPVALELSARLFGPGQIEQSLLSQQQRMMAGQPSIDIVLGLESLTRVTTDAGSLLEKSPSPLGVGTQRRTPIVTDPRVRGGRVGQLAASGSHWIPARIDLDTVLSKIDSRIVEDIIVVKGPYSVLYGPGLHFLDVELLKAPRYAGGFESHGSTSFDYKVNGEQWYGRQALWGGNSDFGYRVGYGHRTGNDYTTGAGAGVPSSYKSRDVDVALGVDLSPGRSLEFSGIRLDQTDVEFPGYAFDIDYLVTDGYDLQYVMEDCAAFDRLTFAVWYNRTRFTGDAQRPAKRRQFPFLDYMHYVGFTDVDSVSSGFRVVTTWGEDDGPQWNAGVDLRQIKQELNEIASGQIGFNIFKDANSPLPKSRSTNPGLFIERVLPFNERTTVTAGARVDFTTTNVVDDPQKLAKLGNQVPQSSLADILGTGEWEQDFQTWSVYLTGQHELGPHWKLLGGIGHGQRPPSLTELYVAQSFMFLLQNGLNTVTGDPKLHPERLWQCDLGLNCEFDRFRGGINGFHAWALDYITFENLSVYYGPPFGQAEQVNLKYVNTDLATFAGVELHAEYDWTDRLTPFATLQYIDGRDRTRNGYFATRPVSPGSPSQRVIGLPRGFFSGITGASNEPLPGIPPLESRVGVRLHDASPDERWAVELYARIVNDQDQVARSLLETPTPGFTTWDVRGYWQASDHLLLVAGVENFTDKNYREHFDFRAENGIAVFQPGVNFYFGAESTY